MLCHVHKKGKLSSTGPIFQIRKVSFVMVTRGEGWGEGIVRAFGIDMYTLLYLKWITSKVLLYSTGNSAQCYVAAWMGQEFGGEWIQLVEI